VITNDEKAAVWIGHGEKQLIFYPFGIAGRGYRVPADRFDEIAQWTFWRAQMPVVLWFLGFVPIVDIWAPSLSDSGRLNALSLAIALVLLTAAAWISARAINRAIYYGLLKECPVIDRFPTRSEKQASSKQFGPSHRNIAFLCFPIATLGILACILTMLLGAIREDLPMWGLGALVSVTFWYSFGKELFDRAK
jgi:hypothetical protein